MRRRGFTARLTAGAAAACVAWPAAAGGRAHADSSCGPPPERQPLSACGEMPEVSGDMSAWEWYETWTVLRDCRDAVHTANGEVYRAHLDCRAASIAEWAEMARLEREQITDSAAETLDDLLEEQGTDLMSAIRRVQRVDDLVRDIFQTHLDLAYRGSSLIQTDTHGIWSGIFHGGSPSAPGSGSAALSAAQRALANAQSRRLEAESALDAAKARLDAAFSGGGGLDYFVRGANLPDELRARADREERRSSSRTRCSPEIGYPRGHRCGSH